MKGFWLELFQNSLYSALLLFLWGILGAIVAIHNRWFYLRPLQDRKKIPVSFSALCQVVTLFFLSVFLVGPLLLHLLQPLSSSFPIAGISFDSFSSFIPVFVTFLLLIRFSYSWHKDALFFFFAPPFVENPSIAKNAIASFFAWWILFPIVTFTHQLLTNATLFFFHLPNLPDQVAIEFLKMSLSSPLAFFLALLVLIIFAPVSEELLFRGYLQNWLKKQIGRNAALIVTSLCFAFFHFSTSQGLNNIPIIASLFTLGLGIGFVYERECSLSAPILLHSFFNCTSALNFAYLQGPQ